MTVRANSGLSAALLHAGGLRLSPIIRRALGMGDDLHSRNTAATAILFQQMSGPGTAFMGGESLITETIGLGGMSAAAAFSLQDYSGGSVDHMVKTTNAMYGVTHTVHPTWKIPYLGFRGAPFGINATKVASSGVAPSIHMGAALREGGHAGAGLLIAPIDPFLEAVEALTESSASVAQGVARTSTCAP